MREVLDDYQISLSLRFRAIKVHFNQFMFHCRNILVLGLLPDVFNQFQKPTDLDNE